METIGKILSGFILIVLNVVLNGFILSKLWLWFIVSTFHVQTITIIQAIGVSLIINYLIRHSTDSKGIGFWEQTLSTLIINLTMFFIAWVITLFM